MGMMEWLEERIARKVCEGMGPVGSHLAVCSGCDNPSHAEYAQWVGPDGEQGVARLERRLVVSPEVSEKNFHRGSALGRGGCQG